MEAVAQLERVVEPALVRDQHRQRDVLGHVDRLEHLARVGELRDHVGAHEARDLEPLQPGAREHVDQAHLVGGGDHLGLVLEAVARPDLADLRTCWTDVLTRPAGLGLPPPMSTDPVTVIGASGALGYGLALRLGSAGVPDRDRLARRRPRARRPPTSCASAVPGRRLRGDANGEAAERGEVVFLCVPFRSQSETLTNLKEHLREGQLVVDATVPLAAAVSGRATRMLGVWQGSAAQQAAEMVPDGVRVVSALHTVSAALLRDPDATLDEDILVCGDKKADKARAVELIEQIDGLRCVDCGRLENRAPPRR